MGRTRNVPIKEWTILRLELQATVLAVRLSNSILKELDLQVDGTFFWSDSMTSLQYIKNQIRRFQTFVANRVAEIHESTTPEQWHHVPASMNPTDEGSRGVTIQHFQPGCQWWSGPCFLWQPEHQWPNAQVEDVEVMTMKYENQPQSCSPLKRPKLISYYSAIRRGPVC